MRSAACDSPTLPTLAPPCCGRKGFNWVRSKTIRCMVSEAPSALPKGTMTHGQAEWLAQPSPWGGSRRALHRRAWSSGRGGRQGRRGEERGGVSYRQDRVGTAGALVEGSETRVEGVGADTDCAADPGGGPG